MTTTNKDLETISMIATLETATKWNDTTDKYLFVEDILIENDIPHGCMNIILLEEFFTAILTANNIEVN